MNSMRSYHSKKPDRNSYRNAKSFHQNTNQYSSPRRVISADEKRFMEGVPIDPSPQINLEKGSGGALTMRAMDLVCPIGFGQRGLIVAPPGSGKTTFLKHLCQSVGEGYPDVKLYCLLIDERPEEVTDFKRSVKAEVRSSSSDQDYEHHVQVADELMQQVYKEVADGHDVMVLIDSLTRLSRVHNAQTRSSGRTISGGVDARALEIPRKIFGAARNIENGGSLTIMATILVETGSRMDEVIFEEFKGTGNMEVVLSRDLAQRRLFPAIDIPKSGTRKVEILLDQDTLRGYDNIRRKLLDFNSVEAASKMIEYLKNSDSNKLLLSQHS